MSIFSEEAMTRPLFEEPADDIGRPDEWSEPLGFLFDPMFDQSKSEISQQFFFAANLLVDVIRRLDCEDYKLPYPVLFLYRHSIELILKSALGGDADGHKLDVLADLFVCRCKDQHGVDVPSWITDRLKEMAEIDPNSTAFRYAENWDKASKRRAPLLLEAHVNLHHLQRAMAALHNALAGGVGKLDEGCAT